MKFLFSLFSLRREKDVISSFLLFFSYVDAERREQERKLEEKTRGFCVIRKSRTKILSRPDSPVQEKIIPRRENEVRQSLSFLLRSNTHITEQQIVGIKRNMLIIG